MKLSELVLLKNQLDNLSFGSIQNDLNLMLDNLSYITKDGDYSIASEQESILQATVAFNQTLENLKLKISQDIKKIEPKYFSESYNSYQHELNQTAENIQTNGRNHFKNLDLTLFKSRLHRYADWHYPAMIIRPNIEPFIEDMVAHDPLYIVDTSHELLQPALNRFNTQFQNRLRKYIINETQDAPFLDKLPDNQFSVVLAYNFLNFRPIELFRQYLTEVYQKLRPGGVFILTFNDADRAAGVNAVEIELAVYTPGYLIRELAQLTGFEVDFEWHDNGSSTWLELKKPGTLSSIKGGQTLAKILPK